MKRSVIAAIVATLMAAPVAIFLIADPRNQGFIPPEGYIAQGEKFGVRIGDPVKAGVARMRAYSGVRLLKSQKGGTCIFREYGPDYDLFVFEDESWRKGIVCVVAKDGRVAEVVWSYQLVGAFP